MNLQLEFINYTYDEVYYYEDVERGSSDYEVMIDENPELEIGVSHFSVYGVDLPYNQDNVDFITTKYDLEFVVLIADYLGLDMTDLYDTRIEIEDNYNYCLMTSDNVIDCFTDYFEEMGYLDNVPDDLKNYIDYEKLYRDFTFSGLTVIPCSMGYLFIN